MMRFWNSASVAAYAMLRRMSQKDEATIVFHEYFNAGCCDMRNLSAPDYAMVAFLLLSRPQLRINPIQSSPRAPTE